MILLGKVVQPMQEIRSETIQGLMADYLGKELFSSTQKKSSISDETIAEIVDDIFLPLIRGLQ